MSQEEKVLPLLSFNWSGFYFSKIDVFDDSTVKNFVEGAGTAHEPEAGKWNVLSLGHFNDGD